MFPDVSSECVCLVIFAVQSFISSSCVSSCPDSKNMCRFGVQKKVCFVYISLQWHKQVHRKKAQEYKVDISGKFMF